MTSNPFIARTSLMCYMQLQRYQAVLNKFITLCARFVKLNRCDFFSQSIKKGFHLAHVFRVIYKSLEQTIMKSAACQPDLHSRLSRPLSILQTSCPDIFHRSLCQNMSTTPLYHQGRSVLKWSAPHETSTFGRNKNVTIVYNGFVSRSGNMV